MIYSPRHFGFDELINPEILRMVSPDITARIIPIYALQGLDLLRDLYGAPLWVNGQGRVDSGVRCVDCSIGAPKSKHKIGIAFDLHCGDLTRLRSIIRSNFKQLKINRMEHPDYTAGWCHVEFCAVEPIKLTVFIP